MASAVLVRNVHTAQSAYDTAMQRSVVNRVESRASQSNAALLAPAVAPRRAFRPNLPLNGALAVVVGADAGRGTGDAARDDRPARALGAGPGRHRACTAAG